MAIIIEPWRISDEGKDLEGDEPPESLELEGDVEARADGPIHYKLHAERLGREMLVRGTLGAPVRFACCRCGEPFVREVRDPSFFAEIEVEDPHALVDLTPEVRESMILAFPTYPVCQDSCRGLCTRCGRNLNRERCGCKPPKEERWTAFSGLDGIERMDYGRTQKKKIEK